MIQLRQTETTPNGGEQGQGGFGSGTLFVILLLLLALFWWNTRRRRAIEDRLLSQRRQQTLEEAEQSARDVARLMRVAPAPGAAEAAAATGLASAAPVPAPAREESPIDEAAAQDQETMAAARRLERAEAAAAAERAAEEQALQAARAAELEGESEMRRMEAGEAVAVETQADTADALRQALRELEDEGEIPLGAVAGSGRADCPAEFPIKGNATSKIYHVPGQVSYPQTFAELCFASAEAAEAAGFRQSRARVARQRG